MERIKTANLDVADAWQEMIEKNNFKEIGMIESPHKQMLGAFAKTFSNYKHQNIRYIESGEWVAVEGVFTGTHSGDIIMGKDIVIATYKKVNFNYTGFIKITNGKVVESRLSCDSKVFLKQLGLG